jgi:hypothetical protein
MHITRQKLLSQHIEMVYQSIYMGRHLADVFSLFPNIHQENDMSTSHVNTTLIRDYNRARKWSAAAGAHKGPDGWTQRSSFFVFFLNCVRLQSRRNVGKTYVKVSIEHGGCDIQLY